MAPSADKLKGMQWKDAMPPEQKALQSLLRAEATFRQIQVAFGQRGGGGGGGGGGGAGRDLASLFDLELDTEKNQYETGADCFSAEQHEKDIDDALAEARCAGAPAGRARQAAAQQSATDFQERWQQEMLRREAEQLQRQMEQMANNGQQGQQVSRVSRDSRDSKVSKVSKDNKDSKASKARVPLPDRPRVRRVRRRRAVPKARTVRRHRAAKRAASLPASPAISGLNRLSTVFSRQPMP